ncbi:DUF885 domain-containing protein [Sphingomonas alba]|uniref:DUF885 domain-containing protein n=1 Tax=Sphingomonas alba TaxID=2908208 RepID=A0ABT0RQ45_9SPHN|nr:DUF885 domain-containing protein [Sphingomonas alba]MCL6684784.1 DUF885 domain-containing protein [Sphingomonas alba]
MTKRTAIFAALLSTTLFAIPSAASAQAAPAMTASQQSAHDQLFNLFKQSDEDSLKRNPISGIFRGDLRYADQGLGDYITDEYFAKEKAATEADLANLHKINRSALNPTDQIAYDVFEYSTKQGLEGFEPRYFDPNVVRPINHFSGFHTFYPTFASGKGAAPFKTVADYENNIKRHADYALLLDRSIERFRQGMKSGVVDTKLTIRNVIDQLNEQLKQKPEQSQFYGPVKAFPDSISAADKERLTSQTRAAITDHIYPAMTRLRDFLQNEYLPVARDQVGLSSMKGGAVLYDKMVRDSTTLPLSAAEVHALGLKEVARITGEMEKVKTEVGFKGTLPEFFEYLRTDPKFKEPTREALTQGYYDIGKKVAAKLPEYFSTIPKAKLEIRPYDPVIEKYQAGGSYEQGTPDGSRPGTFYFNAYDLPSRTTPGMTTLFLHEGEPGHHFQISLAQENAALPAFMRFGGNTAFVEGWALYAETLGYDMGFYKDPYQRMGTLDDEMLRAMRLVVDTGIHSKGWTRDQSIAYMLAHSSMGKTDAQNEVERYIAIPSQALAYKIGALTIQRLRAKAQKELGPKFDIRDFHAQVLMTGALPMAILERKIDAWIAAKRQAQ